MRQLKYQILFFVIFAVFSPYSSSLSFEDLVSSYDYTVDSGEINITNITVVDCNPCDNLTINISLKSNAGDYDIYGFFGNKTYFLSKHLFGDDDAFLLVFFPQFSSNISDLWIKIVKDGTTLYFSNISKINLSNIKFKTANVSVINESEENGVLKFTLSIGTLREGDYDIMSYLVGSSNSTFITTQTDTLNLTNNIPIYFDTGIDGNFTLEKVEINKSVFTLGYKTRNYLFSKITFINDSISEGNLLITINEKNNTNTTPLLFDSFSNFITFGKINNNTIVFNGSAINESKLNGPYIAKLNIAGLDYSYTTNYYNYSDFQNEPADDKEPSIITQVSDNIIKIKNSVTSFVSEILISDEKVKNQTEDITNYINDESDKETELIGSDTLIKMSDGKKNTESTESTILNTGIFKNLLTGNAIFQDSKKQVQWTYNFVRITAFLLVLLPIAYLVFKRLRN